MQPLVIKPNTINFCILFYFIFLKKQQTHTYYYYPSLYTKSITLCKPYFYKSCNIYSKNIYPSASNDINIIYSVYYLLLKYFVSDNPILRVWITILNSISFAVIIKKLCHLTVFLNKLRKKKEKKRKGNYVE